MLRIVLVSVILAWSGAAIAQQLPSPYSTRSAPPATTMPSRSTAATTATGEYSTETEAKGHCPSDLVVWANTRSKVYHFAGSRSYGKTKRGAYMCQKESDAAGFRAAKNEKAPTR